MNTSTIEKFSKIFELLNGELSFNFKKEDITKTIKIDEIPAESLAIILQYGTRKLNDRVNSIIAKTGGDRESLIEESISKLLAGTLAERQLSGNAGLRNYIIDTLKAQSSKLSKEQLAILDEYKTATPEQLCNRLWADNAEKAKKNLEVLTQRYELIQNMKKDAEGMIF